VSAQRLAAMVLVVVPLACGDATSTLPPRGQVLLFIDTDAPLRETTSSSELRPIPLFNRLQIDVHACGDVARCPAVTRDFEVDADMFRAGGGLSFGIVPRAGERAFVRTRLFLASVNVANEPPPDVTVDVTAIMPEVAAEGVVEATMFIPTEQVGAPVSDFAHPADTTPGRPSNSAVGTWPLAQRTTCRGPGDASEICIPGGAFWMGSEILHNFRRYLDTAADARRLVVVPPFYLDAREVTVAEYRASGLPATPWNGSTAGGHEPDWCTYTRSPDVRDDLPINCITFANAREYCRLAHKVLPTEARFEYVAGGLAGHLWPWGNELATCNDAIVGRAFGPKDDTDEFYSDECRTVPVDGPKAAGALRDVVDVPGPFGGRVYDLAGNLSEFVADAWQHRSDDCWVRPGLYVDPLCDHTGAALAGVTAKGGNFWWLPVYSFAPLRSPVQLKETSDGLLGFRCARSIPE
jgi:formylglycine-generating enzyme